MTNITFYPYGNANEKELSNGTWVFTCQHGINECKGNMVETCMEFITNFDQNKWVNFVIDLEKNSCRQDNYKYAQTLLDTGNYSVTWQEMDACINGPGNGYEHQMALWTAPTHHQYTPWLVVNGKANPTGASSDILRYSCQVYEAQGSECRNDACTRYRNENYEPFCYNTNIGYIH
mmetsp:Transcript_33931/g.41781  ORF Transcript_33931/g.41781 Transcript_33931/m.41781 type:complete len:176 (+) Transcript_33931:106-633(+)